MVMLGYHSFPVKGQSFIVQRKYEFIREIGKGAYGVVCAARDRQTDEPVAIKKTCRIFDKNILAKRALRELKLFKHLNGHPNIISLLDVDIANSQSFNELYYVMELMEADLHSIIRSGQPLSDAHHQYFVYQICRGLKYIHSANILHRDLKPGNLLVNADCELKICDFGLARGYSENPEADRTGFMTEYVATRWYRAPEIMLGFRNYTKAIDIWSVGCIFAEMLSGRPLFRGRDYVDQLNQILGILGTPDEVTLGRIGSERAQAYIRSLPRMPKIPFQNLFPRVNPLALDLLEKLLEFDPLNRITVEEALKHPYIAAYHDEQDEPSHPEEFDFSFEALESIDDIRSMTLQGVMAFKTSMRNAQQPEEPVPLTNQRRGTNSSTQERETLEQSKQVAAQVRSGRRGAVTEDHTMDEVPLSASAAARYDMDDMDVIELERELSGVS